MDRDGGQRISHHMMMRCYLQCLRVMFVSKSSLGMGETSWS